MSGFLYFLPQCSRLAIQSREAAAAGLGHAVSGEGIDCRSTSAGPGGAAGLLLSFGGVVDLRFEPERQSWRRSPGADWWAGLWNDVPPPGPADLKRPRQYEGETVTMRDGRDWVVPRCYAALPGRPSSLPKMLDLSEQGTWIGRVAPEYEKLSADAYRVWESFLGCDAESDQGLTGEDEVRIAAAALAVNYRLSPLEIAMLGLWSTDEVARVLRSMIDADLLLAELKVRSEAEAKKNGSTAAGISSTGSGATG